MEQFLRKQGYAIFWKDILWPLRSAHYGVNDSRFRWHALYSSEFAAHPFVVDFDGVHQFPWIREALFKIEVDSV